VSTGFRLVPGFHLSQPHSAVRGELMDLRDISAVLKEHDEEFLAISGVTGVYVGLARDGRTPCLKVMATKATATLRRQVPRRLDGYDVVLEEAGVIRSLNGN